MTVLCDFAMTLERDPDPMHSVYDLLDRFGGSRYLTTLDLCKGYWRVPLLEETNPGQCSEHHSGNWSIVMLLGLKGALATTTFQRLMDGVLEGVLDYAGAYLGNIIIFSHTWEDHLVHVQDILQRIKDAGLTMNLSKCTFAQSQVEYLGFVIGVCNDPVLQQPRLWTPFYCADRCIRGGAWGCAVTGGGSRSETHHVSQQEVIPQRVQVFYCGKGVPWRQLGASLFALLHAGEELHCGDRS